MQVAMAELEEQVPDKGPQFIDFDKWHGKAFKVVTTPAGRSTDRQTGKSIADEAGRMSVVTPENGEAWNWPTAPQEGINAIRKNWATTQADPASKYKMDQIRRAMK